MFGKNTVSMFIVYPLKKKNLNGKYKLIALLHDMVQFNLKKFICKLR